ncbi:MAG: CRTAC1 family protein [Phycisphaerales bacterium]|nr:CRTAC1 family protein [Phycisphaerales bacterium]
MTNVKNSIDPKESSARDTPDTDGSQQYVPEDDAIIGTFFWWSLSCFIGVGLVIVIVVLVINFWPAPEEIIQDKDVGAIKPLVADVTVLPEVAFKDVTAASGIDFIHTSGARGEKLLPETMGSGAAFFDFDGDEDQDLLLINARPWPHTQGDSSEVPSIMALYENDGAGQFSDVTDGSGLNVPLYGVGVTAGDYDGDNQIDIFVSSLGQNVLFRNRGNGQFEDVSEQAGVSGSGDAWSTSGAFVDYDNDGDLDLFVTNYVQWTEEIDRSLHFSLNGVDRAYGPPTLYKGSHSNLYQNSGDGTFVDVSQAAGIQVDSPHGSGAMGKGLAVMPVDYDLDGDIDLIVANDTVQNFLFDNQGDGTFLERGAASGLAFASDGQATGAMGIDAADYRNDGSLGVGIGNFANEMTSLYVTQGQDGFFADEAIGEGIGSPTRPLLSFGLFFFDYDLDGRLDLFQTNGHLEETINEVQASQFYRQPSQLFWNSGPGQRSTFKIVPAEKTGDLAIKTVGRAASYADIDGDGDLDILITQTGDRPILMRNDQELGHHWIRLRLAGDGKNPDAIGARIELTANGVTQRRQVMPTRSYLSQVELPITFGLEDADHIDSLLITWPDGYEQFIEGLEIDRFHVISKEEPAS